MSIFVCHPIHILCQSQNVDFLLAVGHSLEFRALQQLQGHAFVVELSAVGVLLGSPRKKADVLQRLQGNGRDVQGNADVLLQGWSGRRFLVLLRPYHM